MKSISRIKLIILIILIIIITMSTISIYILNYWTVMHQTTYIASESMQPTLLVNDRLLHSNLLPDEILQRGTIVCFYLRSDQNKKAFNKDQTENIKFLGRIIGLPNEKIEIKSNIGVLVNDKLLVENYISGKKQFKCNDRESFCKSHLIPENTYFILKDNRDNSIDSRIFGEVDRVNIISKALYIYYPINRAKEILVPTYVLKKQ